MLAIYFEMLYNTLNLNSSYPKGGKIMVTIVVRDNNVEQGLRVLKRKMQKDGLMRELRMRKFYEKPSEKKKRKKEECIRRTRKNRRKRLSTEGY